MMISTYRWCSDKLRKYFPSYIVLRIWQLNPYLLNSLTLTLEEEEEAWLEWLEYIYSIINGLVKTMFGAGGGMKPPMLPPSPSPPSID